MLQVPENDIERPPLRMSTSTLCDAENGDGTYVFTRQQTVAAEDTPAHSKEAITSDISLTAVSTPHAAKLDAVSPPATRKRKVRKFNKWMAFKLWFNTYRRLWTFVVIFNIVGLVLAATSVWHYPRRYTGAFVLGNLLASVAVRNELLGRALYLIVNTLFAKWTPLWFRLGCTSFLQHLGGIHSGCGVSGLGWLVFRIVLIATDVRNMHGAVVVMGGVTSLAIATTILAALPWIRNTYHNMFEWHHRFVGWFALISTWVFVILGDSYNIDEQRWDADSTIVKQQTFFFCLGMTFFIIFPWTVTRKVAVEVEIPSSKVAILKFKRGMQQGMLARISRGPISEYHAFGIISEGTHTDAHYLVCGVQGDFTRGLVENPPTHVWTRELKVTALSNTSKLYKRGIRIVTGTAIGAALATCIQSKDWYLIWVGSDQQKTFGPSINKMIADHVEPERRTLWDSKERGGRPDLMKLLTETYDSWGAEVVFITSNWTGNKTMMEGCKSEGIPAFGTLWDF
ncbi:hypothetical protein CYLTODRAFT_453876 [Cylindrobasidium torrendii FP15055 ss-10]|uniref:Non-ribosomal peptide synthetase n=1 Tax=Cylindrobasidium torrendii FP15055 ss-10 TaxID=1314674 RepID=A0A0D7BC42_9AGAR|nr:hypothetical protein CYLTODRAFT_453876 [Cylindrobasidium torrendii FP15055 ss-10]